MTRHKSEMQPIGKQLWYLALAAQHAQQASELQQDETEQAQHAQQL